MYNLKTIWIWDGELAWAATKLKGRGLQRKIGKLAWAATILSTTFGIDRNVQSRETNMLKASMLNLRCTMSTSKIAWNYIKKTMYFAITYGSFGLRGRERK